MIDAGGRRSPIGSAGCSDLGVGVRRGRPGQRHHLPHPLLPPDRARRRCRRSCSPALRAQLEARARAGLHRRPPTRTGSRSPHHPGTRSSGCSGTTGRSTPSSPRSRTPHRGGSPRTGRPLHDVATMAGHQNVLRHWMCDGEPVVLGVLPVGDSLCTTNPAYGWGASMALTYAFAAVEAISDGRRSARHRPALPRRGARRGRRRVPGVGGDGSHAWLSLARANRYPSDDVAEAERQSLIAEGVIRGSFRDPVLGRAFLRRINLLDAPHAILDDPEVEQHAREMREYYASRPPRVPGPIGRSCWPPSNALARRAPIGRRRRQAARRLPGGNDGPVASPDAAERRSATGRTPLDRLPDVPRETARRWSGRVHAASHQGARRPRPSRRGARRAAVPGARPARADHAAARASTSGTTTIRAASPPTGSSRPARTSWRSPSS